MSKFKIGDRVVVYHGYRIIIGKVNSVSSTLGNGVVYVTEDGFNSSHGDSPFSSKQCRKLVKKERRRVWVNQAFYEHNPDPKSTPLITSLPDTPILTIYTYGSLKPPGDWIEFIEVRK